MASSVAVDIANNKKNYEQDAFDALYQELARGIQSMKKGEVYTIEEAWEEIDNI
ncbi:MAG: hypothetical protein ACI4C5_03170 [Lachnospiraceae bacterium]